MSDSERLEYDLMLLIPGCVDAGEDPVIALETRVETTKEFIRDVMDLYKHKALLYHHRRQQFVCVCISEMVEGASFPSNMSREFAVLAKSLVSDAALDPCLGYLELS